MKTILKLQTTSLIMKLKQTNLITINQIIKKHKSNFKIQQTTIHEPSPIDSFPIENIRNIGIIAHIDAGKTTATERMLVYSGVISRAGEVHEGSTVTDYMIQERERGITIRAAAVSFKWKDFQINLIDTPGHIDFTAEVERSLRVMDSAVILFDASMGVETQTITVWKQAKKYSLPVIAFINKVDKLGSSISSCLLEMNRKLGCSPLLITYPIGEDSSFKGIVDLVTMTYKTFSGVNGMDVESIKIEESEECMKEVDILYRLRETMLDVLSTFDDNLMNKLIEEKEEVTIDEIISIIRRETINRRIIPTLCGSALKNKGIQQLLDSIIAFLPCPEESKDIYINLIRKGKNESKSNSKLIIDTKNHLEGEENVIKEKNEENDKPIRVITSFKDLNSNKTNKSILKSNSIPLGFIFKIIYDDNLGSLSFFKLYHGVLKKGSLLKFTYPILNNSNNHVQDLNSSQCKAVQILRVKADECLQLSEISKGDIGALVGLKNVTSGCTFTTEEGNKDNGELWFDGIFIPDSVFFCSIHARSNTDSRQLKEVLDKIHKEDPSFKYYDNKETGQIIVSGLGELHLEIVRDRIEIEYGIKSVLGKMRVSFKESVRGESNEEHVLERFFNKQALFMKIDLKVETLSNEYIPKIENDIDGQVHFDDEGNIRKSYLYRYIKSSNCEIICKYDEEEYWSEEVLGQKQEEYIKSINQLNQNQKEELILYIEECLGVGVLYGYPLINIRITINNGKFSTVRTNQVSIRMCVFEALKSCLLKASPALMEPFMLVEVYSPNEMTNQIVDELTKRHSQLESVVQEAVESKRTKFTYDFLIDDEKSLKENMNIQSIIKAESPLTEMVGFSTFLRTVTKGEASFYMNFRNYNFCSYELQEKVCSGEYFNN